MESTERCEIAALYWEALRKKMKALFGERQHLENLLVRAMDEEMCLTEHRGSELVGIVALDKGHKRFFALTLRHCLTEYGLWRGTGRFLLLLLIDHSGEPSELFVDTLVVKKEYRSQGIGARLLTKAEQMARDQSCSHVALEVIDTNEQAKRFYERQGYAAETYEALPFFQQRFGFSGSYRMKKRIV